MSVWNGWQADFLNAAFGEASVAAEHFLTLWHQNAYSDCQFNPIDLSQVNDLSHNCEPFRDTSGRSYQRYDSHAGAIGGFAAQMGRNDYTELRAAIGSGDPLHVSNSDPVVAELKLWGSSDFAAIYKALAKPPPPPPPHDAATLKGWADLKHTFNHRGPAALTASQHARREALRSIRRASKVLG